MLRIYEGVPGPGMEVVIVRGPALAAWLAEHTPENVVEPLLGWPDRQMRQWRDQYGDISWVGESRPGGHIHSA